MVSRSAWLIPPSLLLLAGWAVFVPVSYAFLADGNGSHCHNSPEFNDEATLLWNTVLANALVGTALFWLPALVWALSCCFPSLWQRLQRWDESESEIIFPRDSEDSAAAAGADATV